MAFFGFKQSNPAISSMIKKLKAADVEPSEMDPPAPTTSTTAPAPVTIPTADDAGHISEASNIQSK